MLRADLQAALLAAKRRSLRHHLGGAMALEYALIAAIISLAVVAAMNTLGVSLESLLDQILAIFTDHTK